MVSETLEHVVPILVKFTANTGIGNKWNFGGGKFRDTAKKWTLPVLALLPVVSGQMLSIDEKQGILGGAQWVTPCSTPQTRQATYGARSCKCQLVVSKPKNETECILNIYAQISRGHGFKNVRMTLFSECVLRIPPAICVLTCVSAGH